VSYAKRLLQLDRFEEAEEYFSQARVAAHAVGEPGLQASALLGLLAVKREQQDLAGARAALHGAEDFIKRRFPASHRARSSLLFETGLLYLAEGAFSQAATVLEDVAAHYSLAAGSGPDELLALTALTQCEIALGNTAAAVEYAERARALASRFALPGQPSYWVGYCLLVQAQVEVALGNRAAARAHAANALEQLLPSAGKDVRVTRKATEMAATP
jgi:tetratricopeptide (TPR) repeat protein